MRLRQIRVFLLCFLLASLSLFPLTARGESIVSWGGDGSGNIVSGSPGGDQFKAIAAGPQNSMALTVDGAIVIWGRDNSDQISGAPASIGYTTIAVGGDFGLTLAANGSITMWGNDIGGTEPPGTGFIAIAAGNFSHAHA